MPTPQIQRTQKTMQYKTIVLELIEERPGLHEELKSSNSLLSTVNQMATL